MNRITELVKKGEKSIAKQIKREQSDDEKKKNQVQNVLNVQTRNWREPEKTLGVLY